MAEDKEREDGQERPSRPVTAAARRERRASARPAARKDGAGKATESSDPTKAGPKGKDAAKKDTATAGRKPKAAVKGEATSADRKGRPTPTRDRKDSPSIFARIARFMREVVAELRKVIWPTRKQMITYTAVVLAFVAFMVAVIAGLDLALAKGVVWLFG